MNRKNLYLLLGIIIVGIAGYYIYRKYFKASRKNGNGCNTCTGPINISVKESSAGDIESEVSTTRILYEDPTMEPGFHLYADPIYGTENTTDITYGFNGFGDNAPTNLSVPLLARDKQVYIMNPNANGGVIKDYV